MAQLLLGVDGGGSKTEAILAVVDPDSPTRWRELGTGRAEGCNVARKIEVAPIQSAIERAFQNAGLAPESVVSACFALAGCGAKATASDATAQIRNRQLAKQFRVVTDAEPLLAHVPSDRVGIALIAGTGSLAWGRNHAGHARAGGWGPLLGDEGGGYWITLTALKAVVRAADGFIPPTALTPLMLELFHVSDVRALPPLVAQSDRRSLAQLAPHVLTLAQQQPNDEAAEHVVRQAVEELARLILRVANQLDARPRPVSLALAGGILVHHPDLVKLLRTCLADSQQPLNVDSLTLVDRPAAGAVTLAMQYSLS